MIARVTAKNFQSLEDVALDLGLITVIVGHSDSGKSAFLRAIESAAFNVSVWDYATHLIGKDDTESLSVCLKLDDGREVLWERTKSTAKYFITTSHGEVTELAKLGRGNVPEDVQNALGLREITIDTNDVRRLQFSSQHDSPFLVYDKGGVFASRVLGRLTGVNVLSAAQKDCYSDKGKTVDELSTSVKEVIRLQTELGGYEGLEQQQQMLLALKQRVNELTDRQKKLRDMQRLAASWKASSQELSRCLVMASRAAPFAEVDPRLGILGKAIEQWESRKRILISGKQIESARLKIGFVPADWDVPNLSRLESLRPLVARWKQALGELADVRGRAAQAQGRVDELENELAGVEEKCPLCPFVSQFQGVCGVFRCKDLMRSING